MKNLSVGAKLLRNDRRMDRQTWRS